MIDCTVFIQIEIAAFFSPNNTKIYKTYKPRATMEIDLKAGTTKLQLKSVTSADTRVYNCKVQDPDDEEGRPSDTVKLVVLGKTSERC